MADPGLRSLYLKYLDIKGRNLPTCTLGRDERMEQGKEQRSLSRSS